MLENAIHQIVTHYCPLSAESLADFRQDVEVLNCPKGEQLVKEGQYSDKFSRKRKTARSVIPRIHSGARDNKLNFAQDVLKKQAESSSLAPEFIRGARDNKLNFAQDALEKQAESSSLAPEFIRGTAAIFFKSIIPPPSTIPQTTSPMILQSAFGF